MPADLRILDLALCCAVALMLSALFRPARAWRATTLSRELLDVWGYWTTACLAMLAVLRATGQLPAAQQPWLLAAAHLYLAVLTEMMVVRIALRLSLRHVHALAEDHRTAAFIGATPTAAYLGDAFARERWIGIDVVGVFDDRCGEDGRLGGTQRVAGPIDRLLAMARDGRVSQIYVALPMAAEARVRQIIERFADTTASIHYCPPMADLDMVGGRWDEIGGQPLIGVIETPFLGSSRAVKRIEDLVLVALALTILLPVMIACAIAVRCSSPGPILFRQTRYGLDGKPFAVLKFRTMYVAETDRDFVQARRGDPRVTPVGAILRRTSLDELPQLLNVLGGSMSVVGPRPHPVKLNEEYRGIVRRYMVRHKIKPGITGLAQINGARGETDCVEKMARRIGYDLDYIRRWSLGLDLKILARTLMVPFTDTNAY